MLSPKQAQCLASNRGLVSSQREMDNEDLAIRYSQHGLPLIPNHAAFVDVCLDDGVNFSHADLQEFAAAVGACAGRC